MPATLPPHDYNALDHIKIVMVNTTLPANIGAAARAMKTMGLSQLVLVAPKTFPAPEATALAAGAQDILNAVQVVATLEDALADCTLVLATSARTRHIAWPLLEVRAAAQLAIDEIRAQRPHSDVPIHVAIVFGREDRGLTNEELSLAHYHLTIPVNPDYGVLNVGQAIQIVAYELRMQLHHTVSTSTPAHDTPESEHVNQAAMQQFYPHLEAMLVDIDFLDPNNPRLLPLRLKRLFGRMRLDQIEYNLLRGIFGRVQALAKGVWPPSNDKHNGEQG